MEYTLFNDIPVPKKNTRNKYPFGKMIIGQSFVLNTSDEAQSARKSATQFARKHPGWDYTCQKQEDGYWRFWRIA
jgi:hypothetical protein